MSREQSPAHRQTAAFVAFCRNTPAAVIIMPSSKMLVLRSSILYSPISAIVFHHRRLLALSEIFENLKMF